VKRVLAYYEEQAEEDCLVADEAAIEPSETVMNVPHDLVPKAEGKIAISAGAHDTSKRAPQRYSSPTECVEGVSVGK